MARRMKVVFDTAQTGRRYVRSMVSGWFRGLTHGTDASILRDEGRARAGPFQRSCCRGRDRGIRTSPLSEAEWEAPGQPDAIIRAGLPYVQFLSGALPPPLASSALGQTASRVVPERKQARMPMPQTAEGLTMVGNGLSARASLGAHLSWRPCRVRVRKWLYACACPGPRPKLEPRWSLSVVTDS